MDGINPVSDNQWNDIENWIGEATAEIMSNALIGTYIFAGYDVSGMEELLLCDGATYNRVDYPILYSRTIPSLIIDADTFKVPDLRERFLYGYNGTFTLELGATGGEERVQLTEAELPAHSHSYNQPSFNVDIESAGVPDPLAMGQPFIPTQTSIVGSNESHQNMPPFYAVAIAVIAR
jgi:microcystin-dependent protein